MREWTGIYPYILFRVFIKRKPIPKEVRNQCEIVVNNDKNKVKAILVLK